MTEPRTRTQAWDDQRVCLECGWFDLYGYVDTRGFICGTCGMFCIPEGSYQEIWDGSESGDPHTVDPTTLEP